MVRPGEFSRLAAEPAIRAGLDGLDAAAPALLAQTEAWSRINSGSYERAGLERMRGELLRAFACLPGAPECVPLSPSERVRADGEIEPIEHGASVRVRVRPHAPVQIALTGHYDTVFPASSPFQAPRREGNALNGPGCADMKGGIALMHAALAAFEALPGARRAGYTVLLSPDEEIGSLASATLLAELGAQAHVGMTYEPALPSGGLVSARKGSGNFAIAIRGRAAHAGRDFAAGRSAIEAGAQAALALLALNGKREGVTLNVGVIDGGGPVNIVPERAVVRFNVRAPDAAGMAWIEAALRDIVRDLNGRDGIGADLHGRVTRPPKPLTAALETLIGWTKAAGGALDLDLPFAPTGGVCEGNNLAAAGCPNIDTLGCRGGEIHSAREFALIDSFAERAKLSFLLLAAFDAALVDPRELRSA